MSKLKQIIVMIILSMLCILLALRVGSVDISNADISKFLMGQWFAMSDLAYTILLKLRLPRIILAFLVGASLSLAGCVLQGVLRNPLADPYIIGSSSGASVGAGVAIILLTEFGIGYSSFLGLGITPIFAFIGSIGTVMLVYSIAKVKNHVPIITLLLAGIAVSTILSSLMSLMLYLSDDIVQPLVYWLMGSLSSRSWAHVLILLPYPIVGVLIVSQKAMILDVFAMGEDKARQLGVNVEREKLQFFIIAAFLTAAAVSVSGVIGFVGLLVPHVIRLIYGPSNKQLIWRSVVWGGNFLVLADILARTVISPTEIPVGIITSLCGGPLFIYLLKKDRGRYWQ